MNYRLSYWEKSVFYPQVDVAIIGSGIVGLSTAIYLKRRLPNKEIYVLERGSVPIGASTRNAGFACIGSPSEILSDIQKNGFAASVALMIRRWEGLQRMRELLGDEHVELTMRGGYELFTEDDTEIFKACRDLLPELNAAIRKTTGFDAAYIERHEDIKRFKLGSAEKLIYTHAEGQLNPGKMMARLLKMAEQLGVHIMNGIGIAGIDDSKSGVEINTNYGWSIQADKVIVATNGFTKNLIDDLDVRPVRNLVLITHPIPGLPLDGSFHYQEGYYYFRNVGNRILLGGGRNLDFDAEATQEFGINERIRSALAQFLRNVVSPHLHAEPDMWWSGILGVGAEKKPIIQWHSEHIAVAVRMGGMGVAIGADVGYEVAEMVARRMK